MIRHGNKFGVKIKASSPSIHMIRANIETEIAPIVGTEQQAQDLIRFIDQVIKNTCIWEINIFGKTVEQLVDDGITTKVASIIVERRYHADRQRQQRWHGLYYYMIPFRKVLRLLAGNRLSMRSKR